ncbi:MAG: hypothetical protein OXR68_03515 [Alphaproteobacteria bacterium]|nr:hypothetical protein [Alphaproteobacteria bacterium]MDD9919675.1 hypothetical protein [Alphaproteobacteria bacterium]
MFFILVVLLLVAAFLWLKLWMRQERKKMDKWAKNMKNLGILPDRED